MHCTFTIRREPVPKKRARYDGTADRWYTPDETSEFEDAVAWFGLRARPGEWPTRAYYQLRWVAYFADHNLPDLDNVSKSIQDGLEDVLWFDDIRVRKAEHEAITIPSMDADGPIRVQAVVLDKSSLEREEPPDAC